MKKHDRAAPEPAAEFHRFLERVGPRVESALERRLPAVRERPGLIHEAMRYTALSGGKRLRPALAILAFEAAGGGGRGIDAVAAAIEMVHAFSLIHDDLPCMDDDAFRRGKPSNHVVYGEGVAVLAGDALLAEAFRVLGETAAPRRFGPDIAARMVAELAEATGSRGVIGGQVLDLTCEGKGADRDTVEFIHRRKTGRLFVAAMRLGGLAAGAGPAVLARLSRFGEATGFAFQIADDLLSAAGTFRELGRDPGRDEAKGKATYPAVAGFDASHRTIDRLLRQARAAAQGLPARRPVFESFCALLDARRRDPAGLPLRPKGAA